jgi:UDP-3-O-[3-hydroxymyristoyl] glucosamine N-acyltransferase
VGVGKGVGVGVGTGVDVGTGVAVGMGVGVGRGVGVGSGVDVPQRATNRSPTPINKRLTCFISIAPPGIRSPNGARNKMTLYEAALLSTLTG